MFSGLFSSSSNFAGINTDEIPTTIQAIEDYVQTVESHLESLKSPELSAALKGEQLTAFTTYTDKILEEAKKPLDLLRAFEEYLEKAKENYLAQDTEFQTEYSGKDALSDTSTTTTETSPFE